MSEPSAITVSILVNDTAAPGLVAEHGFSAWIDMPDRHLLFDTGQKAALADNARELGVDLRLADVLVLSHGHYDHTGGVPLVIEHAPGVDIYAHPAATGPHYAVRAGVARSIAMPAAARAALESLPAGVRWTTEPERLAADAGLTGLIPRLTDYEDTGGPFFLDVAGTRRDPIWDDLALWVRTDRGLLAIVGCSHSGLVNTLRRALQLSGEHRLHAVLGGFHLRDASAARLARTMADLQELGPELVVPCHCTGEAAVEMLARELGERVVPGSAGAVFRFGVVPAAGEKTRA